MYACIVNSVKLIKIGFNQIKYLFDSTRQWHMRNAELMYSGAFTFWDHGFTRHTVMECLWVNGTADTHNLWSRCGTTHSTADEPNFVASKYSQLYE